MPDPNGFCAYFKPVEKHSVRIAHWLKERPRHRSQPSHWQNLREILWAAEKQQLTHRKTPYLLAPEERTD